MMKFTHDTRTHARGKIDFLLILYIFNHKERKENSLSGPTDAYSYQKTVNEFTMIKKNIF